MNPYNRAEILDINFSQKLKNGSLPNNITKHSISNLGLKVSDIISIFESQVFSRHMDIKARELKEKGECFYTCLLYTSPSPRDRQKSRMPSSA